MSIVFVTALLTPRPGKEEELKRELGAVIGRVRKESGCIRYDLYQNEAEGKPAFLFYEIWESRDALAAHGKTEHIRRMQEKTEAMIASRDVRIWNGVDALEG